MTTIMDISKRNGIAGQFELTATVCADHGDISRVTFVGSVYGGPIVMRTESGIETFVDRNVVADCGGSLSPDWIRAFFAR